MLELPDLAVNGFVTQHSCAAFIGVISFITEVADTGITSNLWRIRLAGVSDGAPVDAETEALIEHLVATVTATGT